MFCKANVFWSRIGQVVAPSYEWLLTSKSRPPQSLRNVPSLKAMYNSVSPRVTFREATVGHNRTFTCMARLQYGVQYLDTFLDYEVIVESKTLIAYWFGLTFYWSFAPCTCISYKKSFGKNRLSTKNAELTGKKLLSFLKAITKRIG